MHLERPEAVLPIWDRDVARAKLLARSLARFDVEVSKLWLVASASVLSVALPVFRDVVDTEGVREEEIVPELTNWWTRFRPRRSAAARPGYRAQQLIKLGISELVASRFYLTLDADVIVVRDTPVDWLVRDDRARTVRFAGDGHRNWYRVAAEVLGVPGSKWEHGVTPSLLSRDCALGLLTFLEQPTGDRDARSAMTSKETITGRWRSLLLRRHDWTEYTLYHSFVEHAGLFDEYHFAVPPEAWYGANVWNASDWGGWSPASAFDADAAHHFSVLGSKARRSADSIEEVIAPFL
jgi:hypothetical protein